MYQSKKKLFNLTTLLIIVFLSINCNAQNLRDTHAGKRAAEVVDLLNGTSPFQAEDYIKNQYTPDFRAAFPMATHKSIFQVTKTMFGKVKVVDVSMITENEINAVLESEKGDAWLDLSIQVEPEKPHRIMSMGLAPGSRPENKRGEEKTLSEKKNGDQSNGNAIEMLKLLRNNK